MNVPGFRNEASKHCAHRVGASGAVVNSTNSLHRNAANHQTKRAKAMNLNPDSTAYTPNFIAMGVWYYTFGICSGVMLYN